MPNCYLTISIEVISQAKIAFWRPKIQKPQKTKMLFKNLTREIEDLILEYSGVNAFWKRRFTNDVLPKIDMRLKWVKPTLFDGLPCVDCYQLALKTSSAFSECETGIAHGHGETLASWGDFVRIGSRQSMFISAFAKSGPEVFQHVVCVSMLHSRVRLNAELLQTVR